MRYAIISDIHANLEALEAVLADVRRENLNRILCLGDVVGYGPNPNECVDKVQRLTEVCLPGNHDYAALDKTDITYFNYYARVAVQWTAETLTEESKAFLLSLPFTYQIGDAFFVHATPKDPEAWDYILTLEDALINFRYFPSRVCFVGHSHVPLILVEKSPGVVDVIPDSSKSMATKMGASRVELKPGERYIINVGSVGQPRDLDPRAAYGIYDDEANTFTLKRVSYDLKSTQRKIIKASLPVFLAERLAVGR